MKMTMHIDEELLDRVVKRFGCESKTEAVEILGGWIGHSDLATCGMIHLEVERGLKIEKKSATARLAFVASCRKLAWALR